MSDANLNHIYGPARHQVKIFPHDSPPYDCICCLLVETETKAFPATAFFLNIPKYGSVLMTAAHVFDRPDIKRVIVLKNADEPLAIINKSEFSERVHIAKNYTKDRKDFSFCANDFACIKAPELRNRNGFGWLASERPLTGRSATICGYPEEQATETIEMWAAGGDLLASDVPNTVAHKIDVSTGQSGGPIWILENGYWSVVGIVSADPDTDDRMSYGALLRYEMLLEIRDWLGISTKSRIIQDDNHSDRIWYLRLDPINKDQKYLPQGFGKVNICAPGYEGVGDIDFDIFPVSYPPTVALNPESGFAQPTDFPFMIRSKKFPGIVLRGDFTNVTHEGGTGTRGQGGTNCQSVNGMAASPVLQYCREDFKIELRTNYDLPHFAFRTTQKSKNGSFGYLRMDTVGAVWKVMNGFGLIEFSGDATVFDNINVFRIDPIPY